MARIVRTVLAGVVGGLIVLSAPALGHGVTHALFAHDAGRVDGFNAAALVRVSGASRASDAPVAGSAVIASAEITVPSDGFLLIEGTSDAFNFETAVFPICGLVVDDVVIDWSVRFLDLANTVEDNCSTSAFGIIPQGTYTISLQGAGDASTNWGASNLSVIFVPFGPTGATVTGTSTSASLLGGDATTLEEFRGLRPLGATGKLTKSGADPPDRSRWQGGEEAALTPLG